MRYTITIPVAEFGRGLNFYDCKKADTLQAGLLEEVTSDLICWHSIEAKDIERVVNYLSLEYPPMLIEIEAEYLRGSLCFTQFVCGMMTGGYTYGHHQFTYEETILQRNAKRGGRNMKPFRMGEYWYVRQNGRLIQFESEAAAHDYCDNLETEGG